MSISVGYDVGTMFCQMAKQDSGGATAMSTIRNAFVEIPESEDVEEVGAQTVAPEIEPVKVPEGI